MLRLKGAKHLLADRHQSYHIVYAFEDMRYELNALEGQKTLDALEIGRRYSLKA